MPSRLTGYSTSAWFFAFGLLSGIIGVTVSLFVITDYVAHAFGYGPFLGKPLIGHIYEPFAGLLWLGQLDIRCYLISKLRNYSCDPSALRFLPLAHQYALTWLGSAIGTSFISFFISAVLRQNSLIIRGRSLPRTSAMHMNSFSIVLGKATGLLARFGHGAAIKKGEIIRITGDSASQNFVVYGGTGAGKTTGIINPIVSQALAQDCGMLIFDIKADYGTTLRRLAKHHNRTVKTIGINGLPFNLLEGLTPEMAASFIKSALLLSGNISGENAIWNNVAAELAEKTLGILAFVPEYYSLTNLYNYIFFKEFRVDFDVVLYKAIAAVWRQLLLPDALPHLICYQA